MNNIVCIVVTYNRISCLKECISSLRNQSYKEFDIVVVNNSSTDGTQSWLESQNDIFTITQDNLGGAGGFHTGLKYAHEKGYEWMWLMDDDGEADRDQLKNLLAGAVENNYFFANALVCDIKNNESLAFGLRLENGTAVTKEDAQKYPIITTDINPFNGTFINKQVVDKIGYVKKEMFIWGDEIEYSRRAQAAGFRSCTITNAIHYHPKARNTYSNVFPFCSKFRVEVPSPNRAHIVFRNMGYNRRYGRLKGTLWLSFLYGSYYLIRFDIKGLYNFVKYFRKGMVDDFED